MSRWEQPVTISEGVTFHQKVNTRMVNLFTNSQFENITTEEAREEGYVFYNIVNQDLRAFERLVNLDRKSHTLEIKDSIVQYLSQASLNEFMDDEDYGNILNEDIVKPYGKYGTVILKVRPKAEKGKRLLGVDFNQVVWDQNDYTQAPIGIKSNMKLNAVLGNGLWATDDLREKLLKKKVDTDDLLSRIPVIEVYGDIPKHFRTNNPNDIETEEQYHVLAYFDGVYYPLYSGPNRDTHIAVLRRNPIPNRSAGQSIVEEVAQAQVNINEVKNLAINELRNITKTVYQTTDEGLDGLDLSEIDDMTVIKTNRDTRLDIFPQRVSNFNALENNALGWIQQSKEQSGVTNAAFGGDAGSREPVGTRGYKVKSITDAFGYEAEKIALWLEEVFKRDGILKVIYSYFKSKKDIEELLLPEQRDSFYATIAKKLSAKFIDEQSLAEGPDFQGEQKDAEKLIIEKLKSGDFSLTKDNIVISEKDFIDKVRVNIVGEMKNREARINTLNLLAQHMLQNPQLQEAYGFGVESVISKLANLTDSSVMTELTGNLAQMSVTTPTSANDPINNQ